MYVGSNQAASKEFINRANHLQQHRGPDDEGKYFSKDLGMGHRRLAILDLSEAGAQPMYSYDGRYVLVYNGEIYNHNELRKKYFLEHKFQGHSDTETLLQVLIKFGDAAFEKLNGMWALAFWDNYKKKLLISRDRYGQKPLYWRTFSDGSLRLSSEIKPLIADGERPIPNLHMVAEYLATGNYGHMSEQTFYEEIKKLLPGSFCWINAEKPRIESTKYWRFPLKTLRGKKELDSNTIGQFGSTFESAVRLRLLSDVKVGATLSGGLDSSAIVALMASASNKVNIFTAQNEGSPWDESKYAKAVIREYEDQFNVSWYESDGIDPMKDMDEVIRIQEEPFGDPSIIAHGKLMDLAREEGVSVVLGGQGADELLFGYPFMYKALVSVAMKTGNWKWALREGQKMGMSNTEWGRNILSVFSPSLERRLRQKSRASHGNWLAPILAQALQSNNSVDAANSDMNSVWIEAVEKSAIPHLVHYDDRNAMARSIEGRMPFLDFRLAPLMSQISFEGLYRQGLQKVVLRESMMNRLPKLILDRRDKIGFFTPIHSMLWNSIDQIKEVILSSAIRDFFNLKSLQDDFSLYQNERIDVPSSRRIWRAFCLAYWYNTFNIS